MLNLPAYFKGLTLADSADGDVYKIVLHVKKDRLLADLDALVEVNSLQGHGVRVSLMEDQESDYESPSERKAREEREKYDARMEENRRAQRLQDTLPLTPQEGVERAEAVAEACAKITTHPDYTDGDGKRYYAECYSEVGAGWGVFRSVDGVEETDLTDQMPDQSMARPWDEDQARSQLAVYAIQNRLNPTPLGYGAVYGNAKGEPEGHWRVFVNQAGSSFAGMFVPADSKHQAWSDADITGFDTAEAAQEALDSFAEDNGLPFLHYRQLPGREINPEDRIEVTPEGTEVASGLTDASETETSPPEDEGKPGFFVSFDNQHAESSPTVSSVAFIGDNGKVVFIHGGLGTKFGTFRRRDSGALQRVVSNAMPMVEDREVAEKNLIKWAETHNLKPAPEGWQSQFPAAETGSVADTEPVNGDVPGDTQVDDQALSLRSGIGHRIIRIGKPEHVGEIMDIVDNSEKPFGIKWPGEDGLGYITADALDQLYTDAPAEDAETPAVPGECIPSTAESASTESVAAIDLDHDPFDGSDHPLSGQMPGETSPEQAAGGKLSDLIVEGGRPVKNKRSPGICDPILVDRTTQKGLVKVRNRDTKTVSDLTLGMLDKFYEWAEVEPAAVTA